MAEAVTDNAIIQDLAVVGTPESGEIRQKTQQYGFPYKKADGLPPAFLLHPDRMLTLLLVRVLVQKVRLIPHGLHLRVHVPVHVIGRLVAVHLDGHRPALTKQICMPKPLQRTHALELSQRDPPPRASLYASSGGLPNGTSKR